MNLPGSKRKTAAFLLRAKSLAAGAITAWAVAVGAMASAPAILLAQGPTAFPPVSEYPPSNQGALETLPDSAPSPVYQDGAPIGATSPLPPQIWTDGGGPEVWGPEPGVLQGPASALDFIPPNRRTVDGYVYPEFLGNPVPEYRWYVVVDAQPLQRDVAHEYAFQGLNGSSSRPLHSRMLDAGFDLGGRFILGRDLTARFSLEASYTGLTNWSDQVFVRDDTPNTQAGTGDLTSPFTDFGNPATVGLDFNDFAQIAYTSSYDNVELNIRQKLIMPEGPYEFFLLYGLRYSRVNESFQYLTTSSSAAGSRNLVNVAANNDLFAVQIGGLMQIRAADFWGLELEAKGAIASNDASQQTGYLNETGAVSTFTQTGRNETRTAFIGDLSLVANYTITPRFTLRLGYHATVITGVALGADNFERDINTLRLGPGRLDHDGQILYHGPNIGGVFRW
ncbi:BBP7 family outer membrane beta-barrel protein [Lignipirellula cremea]|nr:BBP7 family outer membrane beta-barrel protein [Lignipirellula cremea]